MPDDSRVNVWSAHLDRCHRKNKPPSLHCNLFALRLLQAMLDAGL